jgi:hypothetical protein
LLDRSAVSAATVVHALGMPLDDHGTDPRPHRETGCDDRQDDVGAQVGVQAAGLGPLPAGVGGEPQDDRHDAVAADQCGDDVADVEGTGLCAAASCR